MSLLFKCDIEQLLKDRYEISLGGNGKRFKCLLSTYRNITRRHNSLSDMEQTFGNEYNSITRIFNDGSIFFNTAIEEAHDDIEGYMLNKRLKSFENM